jgi:hypothetical protein
MNQNLISQVGQIGTGAAFILFPLIFIFAFAVHPGLLRPRLLQPEAIIQRARRNKLLQLAHSAVQCVATLAELPLSDRRAAGWHTRWTGNHQSERFHSDGNCFDPLWDTAHRKCVVNFFDELAGLSLSW